jgi:hypothetical protein
MKHVAGLSAYFANFTPQLYGYLNDHDTLPGPVKTCDAAWF